MMKFKPFSIRLSILGVCRAVENKAGATVEKFDWRNEAADAAILAGITFFAAFGGVTAVNVPTASACIAAGIAAGSQFLTVLAIKRKLVKGC